MRTKVRDLQPGDKVDLEGDPYVNCSDPECTSYITYQFEYGVVDTVEQETPGCIVVHFTNDDVIGFPPDHEVEVEGNLKGTT